MGISHYGSLRGLRGRVVVMDSCQLLREGISKLLETAGFASLAVVTTVAEAIAACQASKPELVLLGLADGVRFAADLTHLAQARAVQSGLYTILLADVLDRDLVSSAVGSGVDAVLSKNISSEVLLRAVDLVLLGQQLFPASACGPANGHAVPASIPSYSSAGAPRSLSTSDLTARNRDGTPTLSERENQILRYLTAGSRNKLIAFDLGITEATVKVHIRSLLRKVGAGNRTQAAIWAMNNRAPAENSAAPSFQNGAGLGILDSLPAVRALAASDGVIP